MNLSEASILYVEDDEIVRGILCSFINTRYPATPIYSTGSAEQGLELFKSHHQSIVITDVNLEESDGIAMVRSIRTLDPDTAIIFISGCSDLERLAEYLSSGLCHFICKPIEYHDLFGVLDNYMNTPEHARSGTRTEATGGECPP